MKNHKGRRQEKSGGYCYCPRCSYNKEHVRGRPCREDYCPHCNVLLLRGDDKNSAFLKSDKKKDKKDHKKIPQIDTSLCTGCGLCVDICPAAALTIVEAHAQIKISSCRKCRICVKECPVGAIS